MTKMLLVITKISLTRGRICNPPPLGCGSTYFMTLKITPLLFTVITMSLSSEGPPGERRQSTPHPPVFLLTTTSVTNTLKKTLQQVWPLTYLSDRAGCSEHKNTCFCVPDVALLLALNPRQRSPLSWGIVHKKSVSNQNKGKGKKSY